MKTFVWSHVCVILLASRKTPDTSIIKRFEERWALIQRSFHVLSDGRKKIMSSGTQKRRNIIRCRSFKILNAGIWDLQNSIRWESDENDKFSLCLLVNITVFTIKCGFHLSVRAETASNNVFSCIFLHLQMHVCGGFEEYRATFVCSFYFVSN